MDDVAPPARLGVAEATCDDVAPKLAQPPVPPSPVPSLPDPDGTCVRLTLCAGEVALEALEEVDGVGTGALVATEAGAVRTEGAQALPIATTPVVASTVNATVTIQDRRPLPIRIVTLLSAFLTFSLSWIA